MHRHAGVHMHVRHCQPRHIVAYLHDVRVCAAAQNCNLSAQCCLGYVIIFHLYGEDLYSHFMHSLEQSLVNLQPTISLSNHRKSCETTLCTYLPADLFLQATLCCSSAARTTLLSCQQAATHASASINYVWKTVGTAKLSP
jgi:hypothetical protein